MRGSRCDLHAFARIPIGAARRRRLAPLSWPGRAMSVEEGDNLVVSIGHTLRANEAANGDIDKRRPPNLPFGRDLALRVEHDRNVAGVVSKEHRIVADDQHDADTAFAMDASRAP